LERKWYLLDMFFFGRGYNTLDTRSFSMDVIYMTKLK
jgi:hypothetical protein